MQHVGKLRQWMTAGAVLLALLPGLFGIIRPEAVSAQVVTKTIRISSAPGDRWLDGDDKTGVAVCASGVLDGGICSSSPWGQWVSHAMWIWKETSIDHLAEHVTFYKSFDIPENAFNISARMYITADNAFEVSFNGLVIGSDGSMDLSTEDDFPFSWQSDESYVLAAVPGTNGVAIRVANYEAPDAVDNSAGLIYRIDIKYSEGVADTTPPVVTVPPIDPVNATGPDGAPVSYTATAYDDVDKTLIPTCDWASGSLFPIGDTTVTCTATAGAGLTGEASFEVTVLGASDQLADLMILVQGHNLHQGISNSLDTKLSNAQRALDAARAGDLGSACGLMSAFINEVEAQSGQKLTADQSETLVAEASRIATVLGC